MGHLPLVDRGYARGKGKAATARLAPGVKLERWDREVAPEVQQEQRSRRVAPEVQPEQQGRRVAPEVPAGAAGPPGCARGSAETVGPRGVAPEVQPYGALVAEPRLAGAGAKWPRSGVSAESSLSPLHGLTPWTSSLPRQPRDPPPTGWRKLREWGPRPGKLGSTGTSTE